MNHEAKSCPCKKLPLSLSSFTAAEYGDLHSLTTKRGNNNNNNNNNPTLFNRTDSAGYTPLYLAAQNGHVAVTAFLLASGADHNYVDGGDDDGSCGATPLHRASFSGAVGTMRLLIDKNANLLAKDTSFGDQMTPLHKATAGGRYLAVKLLVEALRQQNLLKRALLSSKDSGGRTPLELGRQLEKRQEEERASVKRWDVVAGAPADWTRCCQILEEAGGADYEIPGPLLIAPLPSYLISSKYSCLDCGVDDNGQCRTASWEASFRAVLCTSIQKDDGANTNKHKKGDGSIIQATTITTRETISLDDSSSQTKGSYSRTTMCETKADRKEGTVSGKQCGLCEKTSFALFRWQGLLVCRSCQREKQRRR